MPFRYSIKIKSFDRIWQIRKKYFFKSKEETETYKNPPILLFGCSFAAGSVEEHFGTQISQKTKRITYNFGSSGLGIANMYNQISQPDFFEIIEKTGTPEFAFYIYISDHIYRLYSDKYGIMNKVYINDDIQPPDLKTTLIRQATRFTTTRELFLSNLYKTKLNEKHNNENFDLLIKYFKKSRNKLLQKYPNIKFVILKYPTKDIGYTEHNKLFNSEKWKELENDNFIVIDLKKYVNVDLTDENYIFSDYHPNKAAWDVITDKLANDINNGIL